MLKTTLLLAALCPYVMAAADPQPEIKSETLLRTSSAWNDVHYEPYSKGAPQLSILRITIPPHSTMKWHTHPMPNAAYIISGELTVEEPGGNRKRHFVAGQVVPETVNTLHRGVTGDQGVVLIVFYAGVQGMPLAEIKQ
ncbi:MAG TPA: cupin domain-containing protein [Bryobacteraceae bacterium]|nr:cupin domain-containing protein [Bryobacteraceae bacterium]